jgi:Concanavalin A-like lectin/glucanases superfamily
MRFKLTAASACTLVLAAMTASAASADVRAVGIWHFNEGSGAIAHDRARNHDDGTLQGSVQWAAGRFRDALSFDGGDGAVIVADDPVLEPAAVSVSAWVNSSASPGDFKYIVAKGANGCLAGSYGLYTGANGGLEFYASTNGGATWTLSPDAGARVWDGRWHNVIGSDDGSTVRLYVDGQQVGSGTPDSAPIGYGLSTSNDLLIGNYGGCSSLGFTGRIDEVRIFDRALSAPEISFGYRLSRLLPFFVPRDLIR